MTGLAVNLRLPAALAALLALLLLWEIVPPPPPAPVPIAAGRPPAATADHHAAQAATWTALILARPLFRADRRPLAALPASVDLTPPRLTAIVITAAGPRAIFVNADGSSSVAGVGGHSGAYEVLAITAAGVRLNGPAGPVSLRPLFAPANTAAPAPAIAAPGRAQDSQ